MADKSAPALWLAYANAAPTPKITMNIKVANDLFCLILISSSNDFFVSVTVVFLVSSRPKNIPHAVDALWGETLLSTGHPTIVSMANDELFLCLVPMNFIQSFRLPLVFPNQKSANCNFLL